MKSVHILAQYLSVPYIIMIFFCHSAIFICMKCHILCVNKYKDTMPLTHCMTVLKLVCYQSDICVHCCCMICDMPYFELTNSKTQYYCMNLGIGS